MGYRERLKISYTFQITVLVLLIFLSGLTNSLAQNSSTTSIYTVKQGDCLTTIAKDLGDADFWKPIFKANSDKIENPDRIFPGQELQIPASVISSDKFADGIDNKESMETSVHEEMASDSSDALEKFRSAFSELVDKKNDNEKSAPNSTTSPKEVNAGVEFGGLVINETRSKIGKEFFNAFYQSWEAPQNASNFLLTITEQPAPGMGTVVAIKLDNQLIFQSRLQPRLPVIEQQAQKAVATSHHYLQRKIQLSNELTSY